MKKLFLYRRAASALEYMLLLSFIMATFVVFRIYILRALSGKWKTSGDTFGFGRQYDPRPFGKAGEKGGTLECYFEPRINAWVDRFRVDHFCDCTLPREDAGYAVKCTDCLTESKDPLCAREY